MTDLSDRLVKTRKLRGQRDELDRVRSTALLEDLERRWQTAAGLGPLPGGHAASQALDGADLPRARLALAVAVRALDRREEACVVADEDPAPGEPPPAGPPASLRVLLDELIETGRPVRALTLPEREALDVPGVRRRIRIDALRLRLLFDLDRLAPFLPADLPETLARDADLATTPAALFDLRERLITALTGRSLDLPGPITR